METIKNNKSKFDQITQKYGLDFLVLFGSRANGLANHNSDYDVGYSSDQDIDIETQFQLTESLKKVFDCPKVDLVNLRRTSPLLAKKALFDGEIMSENTPHSFAYQQIRAYHNYVETKPLRQMYAR